MLAGGVRVRLCWSMFRVEGEYSSQLPVISFSLLKDGNLVKWYVEWRSLWSRAVSKYLVHAEEIGLTDIYQNLLSVYGNQILDVNTVRLVGNMFQHLWELFDQKCRWQFHNVGNVWNENHPINGQPLMVNIWTRSVFCDWIFVLSHGLNELYVTHSADIYQRYSRISFIF